MCYRIVNFRAVMVGDCSRFTEYSINS